MLSARGPLRAIGPGFGGRMVSPSVQPAPQVQVSYRCPQSFAGTSGHEFARTFAAEGVTPPEFWTCPSHGVESRRVQVTGPDTRAVKPPRTHWDMLRERRSIPDLEALLADRLTKLRRGRRAAPGERTSLDSP